MAVFFKITKVKKKNWKIWQHCGTYRLLNLVVSLCRKVLPVCGESPTLPPAPEYAVLFLDLVWPVFILRGREQ